MGEPLSRRGHCKHHNTQRWGSHFLGAAIVNITTHSGPHKVTHVPWPHHSLGYTYSKALLHDKTMSERYCNSFLQNLTSKTWLNRQRKFKRCHRLNCRWLPVVFGVKIYCRIWGTFLCCPMYHTPVLGSISGINPEKAKLTLYLQNLLN